jgi:hypothetical protein
MTRVAFESEFQVSGTNLHSGGRGLELIAPTPFASPDGRLVSIYFGSRDFEGRASIFVAEVDLHSGGFVPDTVRLVCDPDAGGSFASDGMLPTDVRRVGESRCEVIYSGFLRTMNGIRLQSGVVSAPFGAPVIEGAETNARRLFSPVLSSVSLCASASWSRVQSECVYFARGDGYWEGKTSRHPVSAIARGMVVEGEVRQAEILLGPCDDEFALTRPFHVEIGGNELLLFSARTISGAYVQRLAVWNGSAFERMSFDKSEGKGGAMVYCAPFVIGDTTWCVFSSDYLGGGETTFCRINVRG